MTNNLQGDTPLGTPVQPTQDATIPSGSVVVNNDYLRLLVREAVEREMVNQIAPIRTQQQINAGSIRQLNQDYGTIKNQIEDLAAIVRGDEKLGIKGLMATVRDISAKLEEYNTKLTSLNVYIRVGFLILIALGLIDNETVTRFLGAFLRAAGIGL